MQATSDRARRILHAVVTEFIETGEPVGSRTIARKYRLELSPASIRNVMADLEEEGYLYQPHTSAGRLPTERGFRLFVDTLMTVSSLSGQEEAEIHALDDMTPGMTLLRHSSRVLSRLSGTASVLVAPSPDRRRLRELHFLIPSSTRTTMLAVLLFQDGSVESRVLDLPELPTEVVLERVHNMLAEFVPGKTLEEVRDICARAMERDRRVLDNLARFAYELGILAVEPSGDKEPVIVIEGQAKLFANPDFGDVELLRELAAMLEEREALLMLLERTILGQTVQVLVGEQAGGLGKGGLGLVIAPFTDGHEKLGTVGVLGPTRMNYPRLVPLVSATASAISAAHERAAGGQSEPSDEE